MNGNAGVPIPRVTGRDGKRYPIFRLTSAEREVLWGVIHQLRHEQQLTIAGIADWLAEHGVPRSHGSIARYLSEWCEECPDRDVARLQVACAS
jgi:hypothetical protein